jgi:hypothetical protein
MHTMRISISRRACWPLVVTALLGLAAITFTGYHLLIALGVEDTNHLETPLALAVARQITEGPGVLYGPFDGTRPLVLIHAPLYYRLAGLGAWSLARWGADPVIAALAAGRLLSLLGLLATLAAAARLATLDGGAPRWAGPWAAALVASAAVFGSFPVTVRPDTVAVAFQTLGAWLVLRAIRDGRADGLPAGYAALGLAACVKQHDVFVLAASSVCLAMAWRRGRLRPRPLVLAHVVGLAIVGGYYGLEEWLTSGLMSRSVFVLPSEFRHIAPADWAHVAETFFEVAKRSVGLLALGGAAVLLGRRLRPSWLDGSLAAYLLIELAVTALLCRGSTGAWVNYAMQAIVFACVLSARGLAAGIGRRVPSWWPPVAVGAALMLFLADARLVAISATHRRQEREALRAMLADPRIRIESPEGLYFVGYPQHNRVHGRGELAHDEWLYNAYEAVGAAEPREAWLKSALTRGLVRIVVVPLDGRRTLREVPGVTEDLPTLGYAPLASFGRYRAWARREAVRLASSRPAVGRPAPAP